MSEKATFCPRCKHMHIGICALPLTAAETKAVHQPMLDHIDVALRGEADPEAAWKSRVLTVEGAKQGFPPASKFDKRTYQRDLMRKRRAEGKAK